MVGPRAGGAGAGVDGADRRDGLRCDLPVSRGDFRAHYGKTRTGAVAPPKGGDTDAVTGIVRVLPRHARVRRNNFAGKILSPDAEQGDRKSTRLNSSHVALSRM